MNQKKNVQKKYLRKTIEIEEDTWEFLNFLKIQKKKASLKHLIQDILEELKEDEKELYILFDEKRKLDKKIQEKLNK